MKHAQYTTNRSIDCKVFRENLFVYLNKETVDLGQHHLQNPSATVAYNLKEGVAIRTSIVYSGFGKETPVRVLVEISSDINEVDGLYAKIQSIAEESAKKTP
jgi:hypothetical protein